MDGNEVLKTCCPNGNVQREREREDVGRLPGNNGGMSPVYSRIYM